MRLRAAIALSCLCLAGRAVAAGEAEAPRRPPLTFFPAAPAEGDHVWALGGVWQIAPMFLATYRRGLGDGFSLDARLQTIVLYNQLGVGAEWAADAGPFTLGVMAHVNGFFGTLGKAFVQTNAFDAVGWGVLVNPGLKAALPVARNSWLTLQGEAYFCPYQASKLGSLVLSPSSSAYQGFGTSLVVEYAPSMKGTYYYGLSLYHTAANYPLWFNVEATPTSDAANRELLWYLGVLAGYEF